MVEFENNDRRTVLSYGRRINVSAPAGFAGIKSYLDLVQSKICVHRYLETDRKYTARGIFHVDQFLWNQTKLE